MRYGENKWLFISGLVFILIVAAVLIFYFLLMEGSLVKNLSEGEFQEESSEQSSFEDFIDGDISLIEYVASSIIPPKRGGGGSSGGGGGGSGGGSSSKCVDIDGDGYGEQNLEKCSNTELDCAGRDPNVNPGQVELCGNDVDDDCDNLLDCNDPDCVNSSICAQRISEKLTIIFAVDDGANHEPENPIENSYDNDLLTRWASNPIPLNIDFDLGVVHEIYETKWSFFNWNASRTYGYSVSVSENGSNWTEVVSLKNSSFIQWNVDSFSPVNGRYVRLHTDTNSQSYWAGLWEAEIWGIGSNFSLSCIDNDADGYDKEEVSCSTGNDCNDNDPNVNPGQVELCGDEIDNNCNGEI
ncbi:MAG: discoidin domain-containing protein, partial [Nanoarchaeota archaeon]|nr:discoidin domain-containing protein [Nanoarchaeota archaeon]